MNYNKLISLKKYPDAYSKQLLNNIKIISVNNEPNLIGSLAYRIQLYPGDIDLNSDFTGFSTISELIDKFVVKIKIIVNHIINTNNVYFADFKAGIDQRYSFSIGKLIQGTYIPSDELLFKKESLYKQKLISDDEYNEINKQLVEKDGFAYDTIKNIFRKYAVIRWTPNEILKGKKILYPNHKIYLKDALTHSSVVKIDIITIIDGKFMEASNFINLILYSDDGKEYLVNIGKYVHNNYIYEIMLKELPEAIEELFYSEYYYNPFKGVKRLFSYGKLINDHQLIFKITDLLTSNISFLYMLKSELDTIKILLEKPCILTKSLMDKINNKVDSIKNNISNILEIDDTNEYYTLIDTFYNSTDIDVKYNIIKTIMTMFKEVINYNTIRYLTYKNLFPIDRKYLPSLFKYIHNNYLLS